MLHESERIILERIATALEQIVHCLEISPQIERNRYKENNTRTIGKTIPDLPELDIKNENIGEDINIIEQFLNNKDIQIKTIPAEDPADDIINSLSCFLGKNFNAIRELLSKIKHNMQEGRSFTLCVKDYLQKDISSVCQFCTHLYKIAFLEQYQYSRSPHFLIRAKTTTLPSAQNFFSGKWLERFVLLSVKKIIDLLSAEKQRELRFSYLLNPQIILPNGNDFELDLIFNVDDTFYWIEAKTGAYQQHIQKYCMMAKKLNLDYNHSIMVLSDIPDSRSEALSSLFSMTVCTLAQLQDVLMERIRKDCAIE